MGLQGIDARFWRVQERIKDRLGLQEQQARILLRLERWGEAEQAYR